MSTTRKILLGLSIIVTTIVLMSIYLSGYNDGYKYGGQIGYDMALDTVDKILRKNETCDTCVSKLTIVTKFDTNTYYISKKLSQK